MKIFKTNHNLARTWINTYLAREEKKRTLESPVELIIDQNEVSSHHLNQSEIVFTRYDIGHNNEEADRIQNIYDELKNLQLAPVLI